MGEGVGEKFQSGREKFQRDWEGGLIGLLCSRNARPRKGLVGRAQWETDSGHPPFENRTARPRGEGRNERAWREHL